MNKDDDVLLLVEDDEADQRHLLPSWRIFIVDDDAEVHTATAYALADVTIFGRYLEIHHAYSAAEARERLSLDQDFAVIMLDVVMETEEAGLEMVGFIRDELNMDQARIILRTGQPGYAPELGIFNSYDINDYRTKAELTRTRLITAITSALRSYHQIRTIAENRRGLELIVHAAADLMELRAMNSFAEGVLTQAAALLRLPLDGIVCAQRGSPVDESDHDRLFVVGAAGRFADRIAHPLDDIDDSVIIHAIHHCMDSRSHQFTESHTVIYLRAGDQEGAVFVGTGEILAPTDRQLLEVFATNITACFGNVKLVEKLNYVAYHDGLTGLPNRTRFILELDQMAAASRESVVALLDLEHFADLNDGLGHEIGNALLQAVAKRLSEEFGSSCTVSRVGADVFGVIGCEEQVNADQLFNLFAKPFEVGEHLLPVTIAAGFCRMLGNERSGLVLLKRANIALNRAKRSLHANYEYFVPDMEDSTRWRLEIISNLRDAFRAGQLDVWFQPQVAFNSGIVVGIEALLRWPAENGGFVQPPGVFIPLAEYSGLIIELGEWVLDRSCQAFAQLRDIPGAPQRVAVNVSMSQFRSKGFPDLVQRTITKYGMAPGNLELEVTESVAMDEPKVVVGILQALKRVGTHIAIDDFGTGYSSLAHLRELPVDCLKIDQAFVREISDGKGGMFAETIVALGHKLGMSLLAEGVETQEQAGFLRGLGCDAAQGYLYARPMPLAELITWLRRP